MGYEYLSHTADVKVRVIADPEVEFNEHEIRVRGGFGEIEIRVRNAKVGKGSSLLAALSAVRMIRELEDVLVIGT